MKTKVHIYDRKTGKLKFSITERHGRAVPRLTLEIGSTLVKRMGKKKRLSGLLYPTGTFVGGHGMVGADFTNSALEYTLFDGVELAGAKFDLAELPNSVFSECDLDGAKFRGTDLTVTSFNECSLIGADFRLADLEGTRFMDGCDLRGADLRGTRLDRLGLVAEPECLTGARVGPLASTDAPKGPDGHRMSHECANKYRDQALYLVGERPLLHIHNVGSEEAPLAVMVTDQGLFFQRGCFFGNYTDFGRALRQNFEHWDSEEQCPTHTGHEYAKIMQLALLHFAQWGPKQNTTEFTVGPAPTTKQAKPAPNWPFGFEAMQQDPVN